MKMASQSVVPVYTCVRDTINVYVCWCGYMLYQDGCLHMCQRYTCMSVSDTRICGVGMGT